MSDRVKVDVVIPVYNEEKVLERQLKKLMEYLGRHDDHRWNIVVADNGSTDRTREIARRLSAENPLVNIREIKSKGRGFALRDSWLASGADVVCYMDVDLSTDLNSLHELIDDVAKGEADVAFGSRLSKDSHTKRGAYREILSRGYNVLVKLILGVRFRDAQCGFKALSAKAARELVPDVRDNKWFFDTELLFLAEKRGYRVKEVPVTWTEDRESKVEIAKTVADYIMDLVSLRMRVMAAPGDDSSFDRWAGGYEGMIGAGHDFYMELKLGYIRDLIAGSFPKGSKVACLDLGSGRCESDGYLADVTGLLVGLDRSGSMLKNRAAGSTHIMPVAADADGIPFADGSFDVCFSICMFHHLSPGSLAAVLAEIGRVVKKGGLIAIAEHNPLNPYTRYKVATCPIDKGVTLISPGRMREHAAAAGLKAVGLDYIVFFPKALSLLSPLEGSLRGVPLGGQYVLALRK